MFFLLFHLLQTSQLLISPDNISGKKSSRHFIVRSPLYQTLYWMQHFAKELGNSLCYSLNCSFAHSSIHNHLSTHISWQVALTRNILTYTGILRSFALSKLSEYWISTSVTYYYYYFEVISSTMSIISSIGSILLWAVLVGVIIFGV